MGPRTISAGRAAYNEAINRTGDEQLLLAIIQHRYGETSSLMAVKHVAANVRFRAQAGTDLGFGPSVTYEGNLVPFSGGLVYEENPTILYTPVMGEKYLRSLVSPIPLGLALMTLRSMSFRSKAFILLVNRVNRLQNPDFLEEPNSNQNMRFKRFASLFSQLSLAGVLEVVSTTEADSKYAILLRGYGPRHTQKVSELLSLCGLPKLTDSSKDIIIPVRYSVKIGSITGIDLTTRSTYDLIEIMQASVQVPKEHMRAGLTIAFPPMGLAGKDIKIMASKEKPNNLSLAVPYRGYWFFIDQSDQSTKAAFIMLRAFWSISIAGSSKAGSAPVLTIPVSR